MNTTPAKTIFVSRAGADRALAVRIAGILRGAGYRTILQDEDFLHTSFMEQMDAALRSGARVVALLSRAYEESDHCRAEWQAAIADDPLNLKQRLVIFRVGECKPGGLLRALVYSDLIPIGDDIATLTRTVRDAVARGESAEPGAAAATIVDPDALWEVPSFTGREQALTDLRDALFGRTGMAAVTQPAAVHGMGGVGKSALAREYAWRNRGDYSILWWLNAETEDGIIGGLIRLGSRFIPGLEQEQDRIKAAKLALERVFAPLHKPALLVFDNIENQALLRKWKPRESCHVLVTSRLHGWGGGFTPVEIKQWPPKDARDYLIRESARPDIHEHDADGIAKALGYLPLALAHAAAVLRDSPAMTVKSYLARIETLLDRAPADAEYDKAVYATFRDALAQAETRAPGAAAILCLAAFYAPDNVPLELFEQDVEIYSDDLVPAFDDNTKAAPLRTAVASPQILEEALSALASLSLIALNLEARDLSAHRLVQAACRHLTGNDQSRWIECAVIAANAAYPSAQFGTWVLCERLTPHAEIVAANATDATTPPLGSLLNKVGLYFRKRALNDRAEPLFRRSLAVCEKYYGPDHPEVAIRLSNLSRLLCDTSRFAEAEPLMRRALELAERTLGPDHPKVALRLNNLSWLLTDTNRLAEVEPLVRRSLAINEKNYGPDHPEVAVSLNYLARALYATGHPLAAEPFVRRALAVVEKNLGLQHPEVAISLNNLAQILQETERVGEAEPLLQRALAIHEGNHGPEHPSVASVLVNIARLYSATGRFEKAELLYRRALAINEKFYGPAHPGVAVDLHNLAALLEATNRSMEAVATAERAVEIFRSSLGEDHPNTKRAVLAATIMRRQLDAQSNP